MMFTHKHGVSTVDHLYSHNLWKNRQRRRAFQRINLPMQQPLQQFGFFQSEEWVLEPENLNKAISKSEQNTIAGLSILEEFWGNSHAVVILTWEADSFPTDKAVAWRLWLGGMPLSQKPWLVSPCKNWLHRLCSPSLGINWMSKWVFLWVDFEDTNWSETRKSTRRFARANSWYAFLWPWNCCISHWRQRPQHHWGHSCAYCKMYSGHQGEITGDQIKSSETAVLCVPSPSWASNEGTLSCSTIFRKSQEGPTLQGWCYCWRYHCGSIHVLQEARVPSSVQLLHCRHVERKFKENSTWTAHFRADFIVIIRPRMTILSFAQQIIFIVASWLILPWRKLLAPRIVRELWSSTCEHTQSEQMEQAEDSSYPKGIEGLAQWKQLGRATQIQRTLTILWLHHDTMKSVSLYESWCCRTKITGSDPQIYPCTLLFLWLFVSCFSKFIVEGHLRIWKPGMKPRSRRLRK